MKSGAANWRKLEGVFNGEAGQSVTRRDIVVIGASAGGVTALQNLLAALPEN